MEHIVNLHIEKLPEGVYLATSDDVPGLVAQGRTIAETVEIARDIAKKLIEAQGEDAARSALAPALLCAHPARWGLRAALARGYCRTWRNASADQLRDLIALGESILDGEADLVALNEASLRLRGRTDFGVDNPVT